VDLTNDGDRPHYVRGKLEDGKFTPVGRQESHALFGLSQSNALFRVAVGESMKPGEIVDLQIWNGQFFSPERGLPGYVRISTLVALNTGALTAFARSPTEPIRDDPEPH